MLFCVICSSLFFTTIYENSILHICHYLFILCIVDRHLGCFQVFAITVSSGVNVFLQVSRYTYASVSVGDICS